MDGDLGARLGLNEAAFRRVNESIRRGTGIAAATETLAIRCECAAIGCSELLTVSLGDYEQVRWNSRRFLVVSGHELDQVEVVVERLGDRTAVVEKIDQDAVEAVEATDPRS